MAQQWHDAVLVLRLWVPPRPGLQRGCRRDVSLLLYSFVRSFQVVLSERGALVGGSQPLLASVVTHAETAEVSLIPSVE